MSFTYSWLKPEHELIKLLSDADLLGYIKNSSAYHKGIIKKIPLDPSRAQLENLYRRCRTYATKSIVSGLTPVKQITSNHLYCKDSVHPFRILARVRTDCDVADIAQNAARRTYQSFSILENQNLSHFPGEVLYGYYTGITPEMIGYIYPMDANTVDTAEDRLLLTYVPEIILDLDDLLLKTRKHGTYCQLSVFTRCKAKDGTIVPLRPDCIIAIDEISEADRAAAATEHLDIITIHSTPQTLHRVHDDTLGAHQWTEWILPIDRNAPRYDEYDDINITKPEQLYRPEDEIPTDLDFDAAVESFLHDLQYMY